jgi:hypothetical protein
MIRLFCTALINISVLAFSVEAAPFERSVGHGLIYYRVREAPADLPAKPAARVPGCVLDLRYLAGDVTVADAVGAWLQDRATVRAPVFVLVNAQTSGPLLNLLARFERGRGVLVVSAAFPGFKPDSAVKTSVEEERRAYEALEKGTPIASLLTEHPDKVRNDEASLSRDRLAEAAADAAADAMDGDAPPPPIDYALQRAVHLHRALLALRKI